MKRNYYVTKDGELKRQDDTIYVITEDDKIALPVENVGSLHILSQLDFNTRFFSFLSEKEVPAHYYNWFDRYTGSFYPQEFLQSGEVRVNQVRHYDDLPKRLKIAREIVYAATDNMVENLQYYHRKGKSVTETIDTIKELQTQIPEISTPDELRGVEGKIRQQYYSTFSEILRGDFLLNQRSIRPPGNEVNALISFGNSLLYASTLTELYRTHLDPTISYLHEPRERRYSLSLDVSEVFKPVIVDRTIFSLVNKQKITMDDFRRDMNGCLLADQGRDQFLQAHEERLETTVDHPSLDKHVSHQRLLRLEAYKLVKHVSGDDEYQGYRMPKRR